MAANYEDYCNYLQSNSTFAEFKQHSHYRVILEHVSVDEGYRYLSLIETEYDIPLEHIEKFITMNDTYGNPIKESFVSGKYNVTILCSPTSLRYIYHSLVILKYYETTKLREIVEVGCGYGGLCLAINYFADLLHIPIDKYHLIDLPDVCHLITHYLSKHESTIKIPFETYESSTFGRTIKSENLFLISNYCFTEIDDEYRNNYCDNLLPKVKNGFMVWQTDFFPSLSTDILKKNIVSFVEERPKTSENYFVYF